MKILIRYQRKGLAVNTNCWKTICSQIYEAIVDSVATEEAAGNVADFCPNPLNSPNFKKSLDNGRDVANELDHFVLNSEHLLLGVLKLSSDANFEKIKSIKNLNLDNAHNLIADHWSIPIYCGSRELKIGGRQ